MKVLDSKNNLETTLKSFSNRRIQIVTAFASGAEHLISSLLEHGNRIELIIGTINAFSSPKLIRFCQGISEKKLKAYVDFRYESSVHWKLYLVEPNIVLIGSANLTATGLSLERDIMTAVQSESLYNDYSSRIEELAKHPSIIEAANDEIFKRYFKEYEARHKSMQKALAKATQHSNPVDWLNDEANQILPIFIWVSQHSKETIKKAHVLIEESDVDVTSEQLKDFSTYECGENDLPFAEGDIVLTASHKGSYIEFRSFDRIIYDNGVHYIYSFKKKRYKYPFKIDEIRSELKKMIPTWHKEGVTEIHRTDITSLLR